MVVKYELTSRIALAEHLPAENLRTGDVATIVEYYEGSPGQNPATNWKSSTHSAKPSPSSPCESHKSSPSAATKS